MSDYKEAEGSTIDFDEFERLVVHFLDGLADVAEVERLKHCLAVDPVCRKQFACTSAIVVCLKELFAGNSIPLTADHVEDATGGSHESQLQEDTSSQTLPPTGIPTTAYHGIGGFLPLRLPHAIFIAMVIFGLGALCGLLIPRGDYTQMAGTVGPRADAKRPFNTQVAKESDKPIKIGLITGMVKPVFGKCGATIISSSVLLGDGVKLTSGLMEITYDTGAKILLKGPVEYKVDSTNGGYLAVGNVVGKVETKKANGFFIRTPTAIITDFGTEFAVAVHSNKTTEAYVFDGIVKTLPDQKASLVTAPKWLRKGEGIRYFADDAPPQYFSINDRGACNFSSFAHLYQLSKKTQQTVLIAPTSLVASAYHNIWGTQGQLLAVDDRQLAFKVVTDGIFGRGENDEGPRNSFSTLDANVSNTDFVGLLYGRRVQIDRIKVFLGHQSGDGGSWREFPRVFILTTPIDSGNTPPESDPTAWRELPVEQTYGSVLCDAARPNPGEVIEFVLTALPEQVRTGYGWAIGGVPGNGEVRYVSITELRAYGIEQKTEIPKKQGWEERHQGPGGRSEGDEPPPK